MILFKYFKKYKKFMIIINKQYKYIVPVNYIWIKCREGPLGPNFKETKKPRSRHIGLVGLKSCKLK